MSSSASGIALCPSQWIVVKTIFPATASGADGVKIIPRKFSASASSSAASGAFMIFFQPPLNPLPVSTVTPSVHMAISVPTFVTGPLLILVFALWLGWLPVGGWGSPASWLLPAVTLAGPYVAYIARLTRTSMLEVLGQDFIRTARAKGLAEWKVVSKHAAKVAILPVISFLGPLAANLLTGSIVIETIFNIPGAGGFFVNSIQNRDGFLLEGVVIVYCTLLVLLNLLVDIIYPWLDRRIKLYE